MSIIKLTIRRAPGHWFCVRPCLKQTTSALSLSTLPLRKWHGQLCVCVCVCCLISSLLKLTNEFQKHTGKVRVGAKELKSRRFSRFPPSQAGMMNSGTENVSAGRCSLGWDPPGGLPGAHSWGWGDPTQEGHKLFPAPASCPLPAGLLTLRQRPLPWEGRAGETVQSLSPSFLFSSKCPKILLTRIPFP